MKGKFMDSEEKSLYDEYNEQYADELSEYYERQSRRYSRTLDCETEEE